MGGHVKRDIAGASVWEQTLYDHFLRHVESEHAVIERYREAADRTSSPAFAYLVGLILEDELRHHRLMHELAESIRRTAEVGGDAEAIPLLEKPGERDGLLALTEELLAVERADQRDLRRLTKELSDVGETSLWPLIIKLMRRDTDKHIEILKFAREWLESS
jgi:rubrerythrin